jgi:ribonuclease Z
MTPRMVIATATEAGTADRSSTAAKWHRARRSGSGRSRRGACLPERHGRTPAGRLPSGEPVAALGGFAGLDPILDNDELARGIADGELRFFLVPKTDPGSSSSGGTTPGPPAAGPGTGVGAVPRQRPGPVHTGTGRAVAVVRSRGGSGPGRRRPPRLGRCRLTDRRSSRTEGNDVAPDENNDPRPGPGGETTRRRLLGRGGLIGGAALLALGGSVPLLTDSTSGADRNAATPGGGDGLAGDLPAFVLGERALTTTPIVGQPSTPYPDRYVPGAEPLADAEIRVVMLGTGIPFPRRVQATSSVLLEFGNGVRLIFDTGTGTVASFTALSVPAAEIDAVFYSHLHIDHQGDLGMYLRLFRTGTDPQRPLAIHGPSGADPTLGVSAFVANLIAANRWELSANLDRLPPATEIATVHEFDHTRPTVVFEQDGITVSSFPVVHVALGPVGYRIDYRGLSVVYSGDTKPCRFLVDRAQGVDLLLHEAMWTTPPPAPGEAQPDSAAASATVAAAAGHTTPRGAGTVFSLTRPRMAAIFHSVVDEGTVQPILDQTAAAYDGPVTLTHDLTVFNVTTDAVVARVAAPATQPGPGATGRSDRSGARSPTAPPLPDWLRSSEIVVPGE